MIKGQKVRIKARKRHFYNAPEGVKLYADPKYSETYIAKPANGVIDSIEQEGETIYVVKVGASFHSVRKNEIELA